MTLIPALANSGAGHVTMLQRSPTYIGSLPDVDPFTVRMNKTLPAKPAYVVNRWKSILFQSAQYRIARRFPKFMRKTLMTMAERRLPEGYDVEKHFGPRYNPWDERLCLAPNGDLFKTIRAGKADVVTDTIERFTKTGIRLASGEELQADIIVTATGLNLQLFGGAAISRNGVPVELNDTMAYKGMMLTHMPNMAFTIGYTNASWTLKADLVSEFVCRVLNYMDANGFDTVEPQHPGNSVDERPLMDFTPGYVLRALDYLPKAGHVAPWRLKQNYLLDLRLIRRGKVDDEALALHQTPCAGDGFGLVARRVGQPSRSARQLDVHRLFDDGGDQVILRPRRTGIGSGVGLAGSDRANGALTQWVCTNLVHDHLVAFGLQLADRLVHRRGACRSSGRRARQCQRGRGQCRG